MYVNAQILHNTIWTHLQHAIHYIKIYVVHSRWCRTNPALFSLPRYSHTFRPSILAQEGDHTVLQNPATTPIVYMRTTNNAVITHIRSSHIRTLSADKTDCTCQQFYHLHVAGLPLHHSALQFFHAPSNKR